MYSGGTGTEQDPYIIKTVQDLIDIENNLSAYFLMLADIDLTSYTDWVPIGYGIGDFSGEINGIGHVISNMKFSAQHGATGETVYYGLFNKVDGGVIKNLYIEDIYANTTDDAYPQYFGGITGSLLSGTIEQCYTTGYASILSVGSSSGATYLGGISGRNSGTIKNCWSDVELYANQTDGDRFLHIGGIVAYCSSGGIVEKCFAKANLSGGGNPDSIFDHTVSVGGIVGYGTGTVQKCVAKMTSITALRSEDEEFFGRITNDFDAGGAFPSVNDMTHLSNYALDTMTVPGIPTSDLNGVDGLDKTLGELQQQATYQALDWDFSTVWEMISGEPALKTVFEINTKGALFFGTNF